MTNRKEIEALHRHDLEDFLNKMSLLSDFNNNKICCSFCKDVISRENIGAIYTKNGEILLA